jgi:hypothetical protein
MANDEDLARLRQGVAAWNDWRARNRERRIDSIDPRRTSGGRTSPRQTSTGRPQSPWYLFPRIVAARYIPATSASFAPVM